MSAQVIPFPSRNYDPELTKRELAAIWKCSPRTIERYANEDHMRARGKEPLPHFTTPGGAFRVRLSTAEQWRERNAA